mgnify:CR=1 FL=1
MNENILNRDNCSTTTTRKMTFQTSPFSFKKKKQNQQQEEILLASSHTNR